MQVKWLTFGADVNPLIRFNPMRPLVHWYNLRRMNNYLALKIRSRFADLQREGRDEVNRNESILDLVLRAYCLGKPAKEVEPMDSTFEKFAICQVKLFLFSGHDTTSSTVCYIFYILATKPDVLAGVRREHASVIGVNASQIASSVTFNPSLLNRLPYTLAVIKEVLRMYPAVSGTRAGEPNFEVVDERRRCFPTDGFLVWDNPQVIHRDPTYWSDPDNFVPERWLVTPGAHSHPVKGAWRPFSHGPRNCIGQELAILEMKIIMVMTAQRYDIRLAYDELDRAKRAQDVKSVYGERGYQIGRAQPSENLPCFVTERAGRGCRS